MPEKSISTRFWVHTALESWSKYSTNRVLQLISRTEKMWNHLQNDCEQKDRDYHEGKTVNEPCTPVDPISQAHDLHGLLQSLLLLKHDGLDDHGTGVHPGQDHEHGEGARDGHDKLKKNYYK